MFDTQMIFGDFVKKRYGSTWVYASRSSPQIERKYPGAVVITPKLQRRLARDYRSVWGREYDPAFWQMLCALRAIVQDDAFHSLTETARATVTAALESATTL